MAAAKGAKPPGAATPWYRDALFLCLATAVFVADQISKHFIRTNLYYGESIPYEGFVRITHVYNSGGAFGLFPDFTVPLIIASLVGVGILLLIYRSSSAPPLLLRLSMGLQVGGAGGNLLDRVRLGHVTDFVDIGPWPVFNVADACIVVGIIGLAWLLLQGRAAWQGRPAMVAEQPPPLPATCPFCDESMMAVPGGRRCTNCGAREWLEIAHSPPDRDVGPS